MVTNARGSSGRPTEVTARHQVQMDVLNDLVRITARVDREAIPPVRDAFLRGNHARRAQQSAHRRLVALF